MKSFKELEERGICMNVFNFFKVVKYQKSLHNFSYHYTSTLLLIRLLLIDFRVWTNECSYEQKYHMSCYDDKYCSKTNGWRIDLLETGLPILKETSRNKLTEYVEVSDKWVISDFIDKYYYFKIYFELF
jgi:hypothetical protein